jgi:spore maturation protein CgeB
MRCVFFYHSLLSDWNHGNAHFLRGVVSELINLGHSVEVFEPLNGWSLSHLRREQGEQALQEFQQAYPGLMSRQYELGTLGIDRVLEGADLVLVHEWNDPQLIRRIGECRRRSDFRLLFHDTHHRAVSAPEELQRFDLSAYDGVLAFGEVLRRIYVDRGWAARAWTWHEAADTRLFRPHWNVAKTTDLAWVGNWGDGERVRELREFLIEPVAALKLRARMYGVRYPESALAEIRQHEIEYCGWTPNFRVPSVFAEARMTVHIPRNFYTQKLPGIPTIRVFEALACAIPLVCAPWEDCESLFEPGADFLVARDGAQMREHLRRLRADPEFAAALGLRGCATVRDRHTCAHRARELLSICAQLGLGTDTRKAVADRVSVERTRTVSVGSARP